MAASAKAVSLYCEHLDRSFGGVQALDDFGLAFPESGISAIIGPNGAGKTTLLNVITGFLRPDSGSVFLGNREITCLAPYKIARSGLARTFQDLRLIQLITVLDNVMLARPRQKGEKLFYALFRFGIKKEEERNREKAMELLDFVGLANKANDPAGEISYGHQKLLKCIRVVIPDQPQRNTARRSPSSIMYPSGDSRPTTAQRKSGG